MGPASPEPPRGPQQREDSDPDGAWTEVQGLVLFPLRHLNPEPPVSVLCFFWKWGTEEKAHLCPQRPLGLPFRCQASRSSLGAGGGGEAVLRAGPGQAAWLCRMAGRCWSRLQQQIDAKRVTVSDPSPPLKSQELSSHLSSFEAPGGAAHSPTAGCPVEGIGLAPPYWTSAE